MTYDISTPAKLDAFAKRIAAQLRGGETLALTGPLGTGKTAFVQRLATHLGVAEKITSPTFTLMHVHRAPHSRIHQLVHVDAYRLKSDAEFIGLGVADYFVLENAVVVVEWAEKVRTLLPKNARWLTFRHAGKRRSVTITPPPPPGTPRRRTSSRRAP